MKNFTIISSSQFLVMKTANSIINTMWIIEAKKNKEKTFKKQCNIKYGNLFIGEYLIITSQLRLEN